MKELKDCPFCGSSNIKKFWAAKLDKKLYVYECCDCEANAGYKKSKKQARKAWNTRYPPTQTLTTTVNGLFCGGSWVREKPE